MLVRLRPALSCAKVMATLVVASLAVAAPAFGMHPPGGAFQPQATALDSWRLFHCQQPSAPNNCYGPTQIRTAYNIQALIDAGQGGSGQTITIVDSFQNPTMASDLADFDAVGGVKGSRSSSVTASITTR